MPQLVAARPLTLSHSVHINPFTQTCSHSLPPWHPQPCINPLPLAHANYLPRHTQHCIKPLTRPKKPSLEPPMTPTGAEASRGLGADKKGAAANSSNNNNNKRKNVPPVTIPQ
eukprot:1817799-Rhodomonas_salina.3